MKDYEEREAFANLSFELANQLVDSCLDLVRIRMNEHWHEDYGYWLALLDDDDKEKEVFTFAIPDNVARYLEEKIEEAKVKGMLGE